MNMTERYTENQLSALREKIRARLSPKRFAHTLSVEACARKIGGELLPDAVSALSAAALLHDIAKELPVDTQRELACRSGIRLTGTELLCPAIYHSFAAVSVIRSDFPEYAGERILSAVARHTVGCAEMTVFDEIVFLADFIEDSRTYESCIAVRNSFWSAFCAAKDSAGKELALHRGVMESMDRTMQILIGKGNYIGEDLLFARNAQLKKILGD